MLRLSTLRGMGGAVVFRIEHREVVNNSNFGNKS
jgi:hypothetical protein